MKRLIVDVSSVMWMSLLAGKSKEFGSMVEHEGKEVWVNGWEHGYDAALNHITSVMDRFELTPKDLILVVEGVNSKSRRKALSQTYKATRDSRPPQAYDAFNRAKEEVVQALRNVGAIAVTQAGVEADDVIAYLAQNLCGHRMILSNDGDLARLIDDEVSLIRNGDLVTENPYGPFNTKYITVYKALVGDSSDNIKGAHGFGPKAFLDFLVWAGDPGLAAIEGMINRKTLHDLAEDVAEFKPLGKIVDDPQAVYTSYALAKLYPEWINTMRQPLDWSPGMVRGTDVVKDDRLTKWAQKVTLVTADNYAEVFDYFAQYVSLSPIVALDIEASTPEESDQWLRDRDKDDKVDVFGAVLTGSGITFGPNMDHTIYMSVDHAGTNNITVDQAHALVDLIPQEKVIVVHNAAYELPVLFETWGTKAMDNGWGGFLPNVLDSAIMASYVDENESAALKSLSSTLLGYQQDTYEETTTKQGPKGTISGGTLVREWVDDVGVEMQERKYKMNQLTAQEVLGYGADDTICTAALYNYFRVIMEIEKTWDLMVEVEQLPAYVCASGFVKGTNFDLGHMLELEKGDKATLEENWDILRTYLMEKGWEGTRCPEFTELSAQTVKAAYQIVTGEPLVTQVRTVSKLVALIKDAGHPEGQLLAHFIEDDDLLGFNQYVAHKFRGEPTLELTSPKQMKHLLYDVMGLPVRIINSCTPLERQHKPELAAAVSRHKKLWAGSTTEPPLTPKEKELLKAKAKTDDTALGFALLMDVEPGSELHNVLHAIANIKKCLTRQSLFYNNYRNLRHWKDGKIHGQHGQSRTVTRRFAPSDPNLAQLPKKGEGVKFRECFVPHKKDAVICSVDFSGQELRQGAGQSMDPNMLACFVGDNLKDMHSMTAAGAMDAKWGKTRVAELIEAFGKEGDTPYDIFVRLRKEVYDPGIHKEADDLRKSAKNVNFGAQYDAQAPKLAETLVIPVADAEAFLKAKFAMFPRFEEWKDEVKASVSKLGYATTCMGARRHLRSALLSDNKWDVEKALRQGPNFRIQGSSAEQTKLAMARLWKSGALQNLDMVFFAPIHDELVWSVSYEDCVESIRIVNQCMSAPYGNLPVPFLGSVSLGPNFGEQIETEDYFDKAAIIKVLDSIKASREATV